MNLIKKFKEMVRVKSVIRRAVLIPGSLLICSLAMLFLTLMVRNVAAAQSILSKTALSSQKALSCQTLFTVEEMVELTLLQNPLIDNLSATVKAAEEERIMARADLLPQASLNWSFRGLNDDPFMMFGGNAIQNDHKNKYRWDVTIVQPIFTGFALTSSLDIADLQLLSRKLEKEQFILDLTREMKQTCYQFLLFKRLLNVSDDEVSALEAHKKDSELYFSQGLIKPNELLRAEVALANSIQQREIARSSVDKARFSLNRLLKREPDSLLDIKEREADMALRDIADPSTLEIEALHQRPQMKLLETSLEQLNLSMTIARSGRYPVISLVGQYYQSGGNFDGSSNDYQNDHNASMTIEAQWKFWQSGKVKADVNRSREKIRAIKATIENSANLIREEVRSALLDCEVAVKNIGTATKAMDQARENWRITELQYQEQIATSTDVLDARNFLTQADTNYFKSMYGYLSAVAALERAVGKRIE